MFWLMDYFSAPVLLLAVAIPMGALYKSMGLARYASLIGIAFVVELPAWAIHVNAGSCVALTGDPSCVAGPGWVIALYQVIAILLIFLAWRWLRRTNNSARQVDRPS